MRYMFYLFLSLSLLPAAQAVEASSKDVAGNPAVLISESSYTFEQTIENLRQAIRGNNFRMIRQQPWDFGLQLRSQVNDQGGDRLSILYFCNFDMVNQAIELDHRVGQLLPCRVTVVERGGRVLVMSINPKPLGDLMSSPALKTLCERLEVLYQNVIEEALL